MERERERERERAEGEETVEIETRAQKVDSTEAESTRLNLPDQPTLQLTKPTTPAKLHRPQSAASDSPSKRRVVWDALWAMDYSYGGKGK